MTTFFNTGLTQQQFLDQYWQKKPLLIRQAFSNFSSPVSPEDLAGLACEAEIESRLIEENGLEGRWQITHGPLTEEIFARLPETHWTMLVQDVDKHLPDLQYLLHPFRFIPDWRRDDLMISYAPEFGTVGPHTDGYDVFLLQAMGTRRWQISDVPIRQAGLIADLDLQILAEFSPEHSWDLEPGDMLYLPPYYAHHGVALNECMTYSIGFRAPSHTDMLDAVINTLLEQEFEQARYSDPDLRVVQHNNEIDRQTIIRLKRMLHDAIDDAEPLLATALGRFVTETKSGLVELADSAATDLPTPQVVTEQFEQGNMLLRNLYYRFAWTKNETGGQLFMAGERYDVDTNGVVNLPLLSESDSLVLKNWLQIRQHEQSANLLCQLIAEGGWTWQST